MINTISEEFEINKDLLRQDFYSKANKEKGDWLFSKVPKVLRTIYQEEFYTYLKKEKQKKLSIGSGLNYSNKRNIQSTQVDINNTSTKTKIWKTSDDTVIESIHPPEAKIDKNVNGTIIKTSLFKTKSNDKRIASALDVKRIME